ncbi:MAG: hypothetical protein IT456_05795 [Planctomycetes bacterium]|nr:hypothetical protein [Planctomycetota bacterium]
MTNNPYEPQPASPHEAGPAVRVRRAEGYNFPPGPGRHYDRKHFLRQAWLSRLFVAMLIVPVLYFLGWDRGWWGSW